MVTPSLLRALIGKYGNVGYALVGLFLLWQALWQRRRRTLFLTTMACGLILLHTLHLSRSARQLAAPQYAVIDLGSSADYYSVANAINNKGQIVGAAVSSRSLQYAFLWQNGKMQNLGTLGGKESVALALNNKGDVVGEADTREGVRHAFLWHNGRMTDLGTLHGGSSRAMGINDKGQVVGWSGEWSHLSKTYHAFLWQKGSMESLGTLPGGTTSAANGINKAGQVVGSSNQRAFLWSRDDRMQELPMSAKSSSGLAINERADILGVADEEPFLYERGKVRKLKTLARGMHYAKGINKSGVAVGWVLTYSREMMALLWMNNSVYNLDTLADQNSGWHFEEAHGLNDKGQIVGTGIINSQYHAFLLTPAKR